MPALIAPPVVQEFQADTRDFDRGAARVEQRLNRVERRADATTRTFRRMTGSAIGFLTVFAGAQATRALGFMFTASDRITSINNILRASGQQGGLDAAISIASSTFADLEATGTLLGRTNNAVQDIGRSWRDVQDVVQAVNNTYRIGGVIQQEARASAIQFSQALASNRLGGDELRAVLEGNPTLGRAIAAGSGIPYGELRDRSDELTTDVVFDAILSQVDSINRRAEDLEPTFAQAANVLNTGFTTAAARIGDAADGALRIKDTFVLVGQALQQIGELPFFDFTANVLEQGAGIIANPAGLLLAYQQFLRDQAIDEFEAERQRRSAELPGEAPSLGGFAALAQQTADANREQRDSSFELAIALNDAGAVLDEYTGKQERQYERLVRATQRAAQALEQDLFGAGGFSDFLRRDRNRRGADQAIDFASQFGVPRRGPTAEEVNRIFGGQGLTPEGASAIEAARLRGFLPTTPEPAQDATFFQTAAERALDGIGSAFTQAVVTNRWDNLGQAFIASVSGALLGSLVDLGTDAILGAIGVPGRQFGGSIRAGSPYLVGEAGPEIVVPNTSGTVVPNNRIGVGNMQEVIQVAISALGDRDFERRLEARIPKLARELKRYMN